MSPAAEARRVVSAIYLPLVLAAFAAFQIYAFHWGVITPDTVFQWRQVLTGHYDDWHPPATTWLWRQLTAFGPGTAPVLVFDVLLYWAGVWLIADLLRRRGKPWAMAAAVLAAALPIPFGQMGAILKDPLLGACCLTAGGLLLAFGSTGERHRWTAASAAFALLMFATATRFNAIFATLPLLVAWWPDPWLRRPFLLAIVALASGAVLVGAAWTIDNVALRPHPSQPIFSLVNFDLAGIVANGGTGVYPNLDVASERRVTAACYDPGEYNPTYREDCDAVETDLRDFANVHGQGAFGIWLRAIERWPAAYAAHRLAHVNRNLRFLVREVPDDAVYMMTTPNDFGLVFRDNAATRRVALAAQWMAVSPFGRPATWITVALGLLWAAPHLRSRRFVTAISGSVILYGLAYAIVSVAPDMRYNFWTMIGGMMALVVAASELKPRQLAIALMPSFAVMAGELIALA